MDSTDAPTEELLRQRLEEYRKAYETRDIDAIVDCFADDCEITVEPGTYRGKAEIRKLIAWDAELSPTAEIRDTGIGIVVAGRTVVWERVVRLTWRDIPYDEEVCAVVEFDDAGKIRRMRGYYDKLSILHQLTQKLPGPQGWILKPLVASLVAQGRKGLDPPAG